MARPPSPHLFDLYTSMDAHERGYVRKALSASLGRKPAVSMALYDALAKATSAQDPLLKDVAEEYNASHHFSQIKRNLYDMIVRHLRTYHVQSSRRSQVMSLMEESGVLADKNLVEAARERLEQALLLCKDAMLYGLEAEIYGILVSLTKRSTTTVTESSIRAMLELRTHAFARGGLFTELNILARHALETTQLQGEKARELATQLLAHPLHADDAEHEEYHHRFIYHNNRQMLLHVLGDVDRGYNEGKLLLQLAKQQPSFPYEANSATIIGNLLVVQLWLGDMEAFRETLAEYDALKPRSEYMEEEVYFNTSRGWMYLALYSGDLQTAGALADESISISVNYRQRGIFIRQSARCIRIAVALETGDLRTARSLIDDAMNEEHAESFTKVSVRMQEILLFVLEQHFDMLPYALRSFERWIRSAGLDSQLLTRFLRYGRALVKASSDSARSSLTQEFRAWCQGTTLDQQDSLVAVTIGLRGHRS